MQSQIIKSAIVVSLLAVSVLATAAQSGKHNPQARVDRLINELGLDQPQAEQVHEILQNQHQQLRTLHQQQREAGRDEICAIRSDTQSQLAAVLNEEQLAAFEAMPKPHPRHRRHAGNKRAAPLDCNS